MPHPLVSAAELAALLGVGPGADARDASVRVLDVRWSLGGPAGRPLFEAGHIPGAVYVDLDTELAGHGDPRDGRHPLPHMADFQAAARRWGVNDGDTVVVYDDWRSHAAVRAWWLLRFAGVADVRVLDGALPAWLAAGHPLASGPEQDAATGAPIVPGTVTVAPGGLPVLTIEQAGALARGGVLLDSRASERYRGEVEPIDPRAGHIPGALSAPTGGNLAEDGRFLSASALRERYAALGVTDSATVGVYCGSGVTAAHTALALTLAGFEPALFPGSWSAWANHEELLVATGPTAG